jgi:Raf kinase inhibitor-like YbhB/YbcL family protein
MPIHLESSSFKNGQPIPRKHTGEGTDVSPELHWSGVPPETRELALVCEDPDAPRADPWVHWMIYGLPPGTRALPEGVPGRPHVDAPPAEQGKTDFAGRVGYGGPMPPKGHGPHRYFFRLYALDAALHLPPGLAKPQLMAAIEEHLLERGELVGTYERKGSA